MSKKCKAKLLKWATLPVGETYYICRGIGREDIYTEKQLKVFSFLEGCTLIEVKIIRNFVKGA